MDFLAYLISAHYFNMIGWNNNHHSYRNDDDDVHDDEEKLHANEEEEREKEERNETDCDPNKVLPIGVID